MANKAITIRLPEELLAAVTAAAKADDRSVNSWVIATIRRALETADAHSQPRRQPLAEMILKSAR